MASDVKRRPRKRGEFVARPGELGAVLADLRAAKGFSLREVEEATGKAVSNAYLSQLENGKIQKPSPNVLHSLSEVYAVPYETLMEKAGYLLPSETAGGSRRRLAVFAIDDLTAEEEEEMQRSQHADCHERQAQDSQPHRAGEDSVLQSRTAAEFQRIQRSRSDDPTDGENGQSS